MMSRRIASTELVHTERRMRGISRRRCRPVAVAGAALLTLVAGPALATGASHTISGPSTTFTAATAPGTSVVMSGTLSCAGATASGTVQAGVAIVAITGTTWVGCVGFTGAAAPFTFTHSGTWQFHSATSATPGSADVIPGHVEGITLGVRTTLTPAICNFTLSGSATASFNEATQKLTINETGLTGNLTAHNVVGCLGQFHNGGAVNLSMTLTMSAAGGPLNVTS